MDKPNPVELKEFEEAADAWFKENTLRDPGFMLPLTFMEVSTDEQFDFLCNWQRKVYEARSVVPRIKNHSPLLDCNHRAGSYYNYNTED